MQQEHRTQMAGSKHEAMEAAYFRPWFEKLHWMTKVLVRGFNPTPMPRMWQIELHQERFAELYNAATTIVGGPSIDQDLCHAFISGTDIIAAVINDLLYREVIIDPFFGCPPALREAVELGDLSRGMDFGVYFAVKET